jgi:hypothetical protein
MHAAQRQVHLLACIIRLFIRVFMFLLCLLAIAACASRQAASRQEGDMAGLPGLGQMQVSAATPHLTHALICTTLSHCKDVTQCFKYTNTMHARGEDAAYCCVLL